MGLAARLRQAKPPARPKPVPIKMKGGRREIARARYPHPDGGDTEMVLMQDPPFYIIWRWDLQRNVFKSKDPKATIRKWAELLRKLKAKPLPQDELMKMESARFAIAALMQVFFARIEGQVPDPEWDAKLAGASDKFRELGAKAKEAFGGRPATQ